MSGRFCLVFLPLVASIPGAVRGGVRIAKLSGAGTELRDADGDRSDWVELENASGASVDLGGHGLSDDPDPRRSWRIPGGVVLGAGERLVVFASGKDRRDPAELHADFGLDRDGESLYLFDAGGTLVDWVRFGRQVEGVSWGREGLDEGRWAYFLDPTPGEANGARGQERAPGGSPEYSEEGGYRDGPVRLELSADPEELSIRYTTDGGDPGAEGEEYGGAIEIGEEGWVEGGAPRAVVVRAAAFRGSRRIGRVEARSYIFGVRHELSVVSLSTSPAGLYDAEAGILSNPEGRGMEWEREASLELYDARYGHRRTVGTGAGIRIHGLSSRGAERTSFRLHFRGAYGAKSMRYPVFDDPSAAREFDSLVLRRGTGDGWPNSREDATLLRERTLYETHGSIGGLGPHTRPVVLYLNGEYWGLYDLMERVDEGFCRAYVGGGSWDVLEDEEAPFLHYSASLGTLDAFEELLAFLDGPATAEALAERVDVDSLLSFAITTIWGLPQGWPRLVRAREASARWRFVPWDFDNSLRALQGGDFFLPFFGGSGDPPSRMVALALSDPVAAAGFARRLAEVSTGPLSPEEFRARVERNAAEIRSEIARESARWGGAGVEAWEGAVEDLAGYAGRRNAELVRSLSPRLPKVMPGSAPEATGLGGVQAAVSCSGAEPREEERRLGEWLERCGAAVRYVEAGAGDFEAACGRIDVLVVPAGAAPREILETGRLPSVGMVFSAGELLRGAAPMSMLGSMGRFGSVVVEGGHEIAEGIPRWHLGYQREVESVYAWGPVGAGVEVVAELPWSGAGRRYAVLAAEAGGELWKGVRARGRVAYVSMGGFGDLEGWGPELLRRAVGWAAGGSGETFVRGDATGDGRVTPEDALAVLGYLFLREELECLEAADADDDGRLSVSDAVAILRCAYGDVALAEPYPGAGADPTPDGLGCRRR